MKQLNKGLFIAVEGIDGSGKSTLAKNLYNYLQTNGYETILTKEPGGTPLGLQLRAILQNKNVAVNTMAEFLLFASDRAQHFTDLIIPSLNAKKIIISDRCSDSSIAYQGYGRGLDTVMLENINNWAMQNIKPDLTLYVKVNVDIAMQRINKRNEELTDFEKKEFLVRVDNGFDRMYQNRTDVIELDGNKIQEEIFQDAIKILQKYLS
jgi:dTMP kinase